MSKKIKDYVGIALIVGILAGAYGIFQYTNFYARSAQSPRSFSVSGEGKVTGIPDIAQFSFGIIVQGGADIAELQSENSKKGNDIIEFIKSKGVSDKDIKTQSYNIEPRYQKNGEIVGYTVSQNVLVKIRDFAKISDILSGVAAKGANFVSQLSFAIDDPANLQNLARMQAIEKARAHAVALAKDGDFRLGRLISISAGGYYPQPLYGMGMSPVVEPGSQDITANVSLTYEIQ